MMSSAGTLRASRSTKDKTQKVKDQTSPNTSNVKATGDGTKNQPTAEQMRLAQMIQDKNDISDDPVLQAKVKQVMELTGRTSDDAIVALHDCDEDPNRAVNMLLEGEDQQGEWQESVKRKKGKTPTPTTKGENIMNHSDSREKSRDRDRDEFTTRDSGPPRDRRTRQPPRLARKNREREENERNSQRNRGNDDFDGESRERNYERGRGRGRGRLNGVLHRDIDGDSDAVYINHSGHMNGGSGRGRGRGGRGFRSSRYDKGPQIETWTNETAENAEKENATGTWDIGGEDWSTDEWTGSLEETKVFTASSVPEPASKGFSSTVGDNDGKMFSASTLPVENQVFTSMTIENTNQAALNDTTNTLQNSIGQGSMSQNSHTLGQRLDLGLLLQKQPGDTQAQSTQSQQSPFMNQFSKQATESIRSAMGVPTQNSPQSQFMTQFSKEATESIKNMMGIGTTSSHQSTSVPSQVARSGIMSQNQSQLSPQQQQTTQQQVLQQQQAAADAAVLAQQQRNSAAAANAGRPQRSKLPPPSKIPASAVEMPGHASSFQLDVQFGNWDSGFSFGSTGENANAGYSSSSPSTTTTNTLVQGNHLQENIPMVDSAVAPISPAMTVSMATTPPSKPIISSLDGMGGDRSPRPQNNMFQNAVSPANTPSKDYSQTRLDQSRKQMTPPDPIPFPSDRKSSPHYTSQRSTHSASSMSNNKSAASPSMTFSQSGYSSSYPSAGAYQPSGGKSPPTSYNSHQSNSLSSSSGNLSSSLQGHIATSPSQYNHQTHSSYQSSPSFQSQNAFSNQGQLYQSNSQRAVYSSQAPSSYQSPSISSQYQTQSNPSGNTYSNQSSSSYHGRDSQSSSSSYQPSVESSQSNSHYQSSATSGSQSSSSYQRDNSQQNQSAYGTYGTYSASSGHQNSLPSSSMSITTSKLSDTLGKVSLKDSTLDSHSTSQNSFESSSTTSTPTISTVMTTTTSPSLSGSSKSVSSALGLSTASATSTTKSNIPVTSKAPPGVPPGVPLMGHNYMMQPGMPFAAFGLATQQPPMYSYEDLQLLQQRLPLPTAGYYDMPFQPPTTLTGRDQVTLASIPYTGADGKMGRVDAQSPVQAQSTQQASAGQSQSSHQQTYLNPTIPPGYNYYYPAALPGGYSYTPTVFPVAPTVTNAAHGGTTPNTQFQKPGAYGSHAYNTAGAGYDDLSSQTQDYSKYAGASQSQSKGSAGGSSSATDIAANSYGKAHTQSFDKAPFHAATPPPFNMPLPSGTQAGPMAPTAAYGAPYVPMVPHHAQNQMLHPHLQQDSTGGSSRGSQQTSSQPKPGSTKPYGGYWSNN